MPCGSPPRTQPRERAERRPRRTGRLEPRPIGTATRAGPALRRPTERSRAQDHVSSTAADAIWGTATRGPPPARAAPSIERAGPHGIAAAPRARRTVSSTNPIRAARSEGGRRRAGPVPRSHAPPIPAGLEASRVAQRAKRAGGARTVPADQGRQQPRPEPACACENGQAPAPIRSAAQVPGRTGDPEGSPVPHQSGLSPAPRLDR
jgi:hypothetical protein